MERTLASPLSVATSPSRPAATSPSLSVATSPPFSIATSSQCLSAISGSVDYCNDSSSSLTENSYNGADGSLYGLEELSVVRSTTHSLVRRARGTLP